MTQCNEIEVMLGAFADGELEPQEMHEVALHIARCANCESVLESLWQIGKDLRAAAEQPSLGNFVGTVMARIAEVRIPLANRIQLWFGALNERWLAGLAFGSATVAVAALTAILLTPYAHRFAGVIGGDLKPIVTTVQNEAVPVATLAARNSQAVISRLEAEVSSVGVWSEPETETTVIWLPDDR